MNIMMSDYMFENDSGGKPPLSCENEGEESKEHQKFV